MTTAFTIPNWIFRLLIVLIGAGCAYWAAWRDTPDLDELARKTTYRACYFMMFLRGWCFIWFDMLKLFPVAGN